MKRHYNLQYWNKANILTKECLPFNDYNEAWRYLLQQDLKILSVKYKGWQ